MASPIQWAWVWVNSGVGDEQGGLACCSPWGCTELDRTELLNWTVLDESINSVIVHPSLVQTEAHIRILYFRSFIEVEIIYKIDLTGLVKWHEGSWHHLSWQYNGLVYWKSMLSLWNHYETALYPNPLRLPAAWLLISRKRLEWEGIFFLSLWRWEGSSALFVPPGTNHQVYCLFAVLWNI